MIQEYGLMRSGTNYLRWIIESNYKISVVQQPEGYDWKHGEPHNNLPCVISIKDPIMWVASIRKWQSGNSVIKSVKYAINSLNIEDLTTQSLIRTWNLINRSYKEHLQTNVGEFFNYNDLINHPKRYYDKLNNFILNEFDINKKLLKKNNFYMGTLAKPTSTRFSKSYYTDKSYMQYISNDDIIYVKENIDSIVCDYFEVDL